MWPNPRTVLRPDDVLIAPAVFGICGTDLHEYIAGPIGTPRRRTPTPAPLNPRILGHEFSARVLKVGDAVAC